MPLTEHTPYLYLFGGSYRGTPEWQMLGMLTYAEIERWYGGPATVSIYGDCITASATKLLHSCLIEEVDFSIFAFAAPEGLLVDVATPPNTALVWYADINHVYTDDSIWIDYDTFTTREFTGVSVFWERSHGDYHLISLDIAFAAEGDQQTPTLYGIYTDAAGAEYLFAYASRTGDAASLGGVDYAYALYALADDDADGELYVVEEGSASFAPEATVSAEGASLQSVLDTINAYAKNTYVLISTDQTLEYYAADGSQVALQFSDEHPTYFYGGDLVSEAEVESASGYYLLADAIESASAQDVAWDEPLYMQVCLSDAE